MDRHPNCHADGDDQKNNDGGLGRNAISEHQHYHACGAERYAGSDHVYAGYTIYGVPDRFAGKGLASPKAIKPIRWYFSVLQRQPQQNKHDAEKNKNDDGKDGFLHKQLSLSLSQLKFYRDGVVI